MKLFNKLSDYDKGVIEYYIDNIGLQDFHHPRKVPLETLLEAWNYQKDDLFTMLGENLILSKDIIYEEGIDQITDRMHDFLWREGYAFRQVFENMIDNNFNIYRDGKYVELAAELNPKLIEKHTNLRNELFSLTNAYDLSSNSWSGESLVVPLPNGKTYRINKGHKIIKAIAKLAKEFHIDEGYEDFRIGHSQVLNTKKLTGTLHLSIHPMDFMTMSDNTYNWDSCLNWMDHGDYHGGAITMMTSPMVVVAYLTGDEEMTLSSVHKWNSKKWRELFIVNPQTITGVKGYPFNNEYLDQMIMDWLRELAKTNLNWTYGPQTRWGKEKPIEGAPNESYRVSYRTGVAMYNDMYSDHPAMYNFDKFDSEFIKIYYEGPRICMVCGGEDMYYDTEATIACEYCEDVIHCSHCGTRIFDNDEAYHASNGDIYCSCCADGLVVCSECGEESFYLEDMDGKYVYLGLGTPEKILRYYYVTFCGDCYENASFVDRVKVVDGRWGEKFHYVDIQDLTQDEIGDYFSVFIKADDFVENTQRHGVFLRIRTQEEQNNNYPDIIW